MTRKITKFAEKEKWIVDFLPFRYLLSEKIIKYEDFYKYSYNDLCRLLMITEIPTFEEVVIRRNEQKREELKKKS